MSGESREGWSSGKLRRLVKSLPPVEVDCSGWDADIPPDQWSTGRFVSCIKSLPAVEREFIEADDAAAVWLELVISFEDETRPAQAMECAKRAVQEAGGSVPDLGLTYDFARSRAEGDDVVIALQTNAGGDEQRIGRAVEAIQAALSLMPPVRRAVARVRRAA